MRRAVATGRSDDAVDAAAVDVLGAPFDAVTGAWPRTLPAERQGRGDPASQSAPRA